jgi:hypothetical protein
VYALPAGPAHRSVLAAGDAELPALLVPAVLQRGRAAVARREPKLGRGVQRRWAPGTVSQDSVCGREWLAARRRSVRCPACKAQHLRERKR